MESSETAQTPLWPFAAESFTVGHAISRTFRVWSRNWLTFALVTFVIQLPALGARIMAFRLRSYGWELAHDVLELVLDFVNLGALTAGVLCALDGEKLGVGRLLALGWRNGLRILGASLLSWIAILAGLVMLVVPGIIAAVGLYVSLPAVVAERIPSSEALPRSWDLTRGARLRVFAVGLSFLAIALVSGAAAAGLHILAKRSGFPIAGIASVSCVVALVRGLTLAAPAVVYHDLRVAKEGVNTAQLAAVFE